MDGSSVCLGSRTRHPDLAIRVTLRFSIFTGDFYDNLIVEGLGLMLNKEIFSLRNLRLARKRQVSLLNDLKFGTSANGLVRPGEQAIG